MQVNRWTRRALSGTVGLLGLVIAVFLFVATLANGGGPTAPAVSPGAKAKMADFSTSPAVTSSDPAPSVRAESTPAKSPGRLPALSIGGPGMNILVDATGHRAVLIGTCIGALSHCYQPSGVWVPGAKPPTEDDYAFAHRAEIFRLMKKYHINTLRSHFGAEVAMNPNPWSTPPFEPQSDTNLKSGYAAYLKMVKTWCADATAAGFYVILDFYNGEAWSADQGAYNRRYVRLLKDLTADLNKNPAVMWDLGNEPQPNPQGWNGWVPKMKRLVDTIRTTCGYKGVIFIEGIGNSDSYYAPAVGQIYNYPPTAKQMVYEMHDYRPSNKPNANEMARDWCLESGVCKFWGECGPWNVAGGEAAVKSVIPLYETLRDCTLSLDKPYFCGFTPFCWNIDRGQAQDQTNDPPGKPYDTAGLEVGEPLNLNGQACLKYLWGVDYSSVTRQAVRPR